MFLLQLFLLQISRTNSDSPLECKGLNAWIINNTRDYNYNFQRVRCIRYNPFLTKHINSKLFLYFYKLADTSYSKIKRIKQISIFLAYLFLLQLSFGTNVDSELPFEFKGLNVRIINNAGYCSNFRRTRCTWYRSVLRDRRQPRIFNIRMKLKEGYRQNKPA